MDFNEAFQKGLKKVSYMQERLHGAFPHITKEGKWLTNTNGHWTGGLWTGLLWLKALYTEDDSVNALEYARDQAKKLSVRINDNKTHDMGFIFGPSCVFGHNILEDEEFVKMTIAGAYNMRDLYNEKAGLILAWDEPGYEGIAIVDTIMNLPITIWASRQENNQELYNMGLNVADQIMKHHVRDDYSIYHIVRWDTKTFEIVERSTHQGYSADTCWSRGQAWALYGFANMYRYTLKEEYLKTSQKLADYFWDHLDEGLYLPRWDFCFKNNDTEPLDASAASIAASGMLLLSKMLEKNNKNEDANRLKDRSKTIIESLINHCFYKSLDKFGIIEKVTADKPRNSGVNESSMYGDYYFMEALYRYLNYNDNGKLDLLY